MTTPETTPGRRPGLGTAIKDVREHATTLVGLEVELAKLELQKKLATFGAGVALFLAAAVLVVYGVGFLFATIAAGLATFLPTWVAILIVTLLLFLVAALLGIIGRSQVRKGSPPVPEQAIEEAKKTAEALKSDA
jgi:Putative Actinobacterial Holin-X, holin superfamily III